jgi:hypothetical protein
MLRPGLNDLFLPGNFVWKLTGPRTFILFSRNFHLCCHVPLFNPDTSGICNFKSLQFYKFYSSVLCFTFRCFIVCNRIRRAHAIGFHPGSVNFKFRC